MIEQSQKNSINVQTVVGYSAYSGKDNLENARDEHVELIAKLNLGISQDFKKEKDKFDYNKNAGMFVCLAGYIAIRKLNKGEKMEHRIRHRLIILICISVNAAQNGRDVINQEPNLKFILYS